MDIAAFLGHRNPATTLAVYCTPDLPQLVRLLHLPWFGGDEAGGVAEDTRLLHVLAGQSRSSSAAASPTVV